LLCTVLFESRRNEERKKDRERETKGKGTGKNNWLAPDVLHAMVDDAPDLQKVASN
jgi:hypothetical protein